MAYFIFNNIDSRNISGMIVQTLPPILKPQKRVNIVEIDGKDGDIIEELGFKSYDKPIEIGLTRNYNIDEIIQWLNGSGKLVLSNEPDKYYNAIIIDNIDFNKLLTFKTATITFHVQPYKYSNNEIMKTFVISSQQKSIEVNNLGNIESKPIITIFGTGTLNISLNGLQIFKLEMNEDEYITLDSEKQEAYIGGGEILKNRQMLGEFIELKPGINTISWLGDISKIEINKVSRWI